MRSGGFPRGLLLLLGAVLGFLIVTLPSKASPSGCWTVSRPEFAKGRSIAVVSLVQDDDSVSPEVIPSLVEQDFRSAGFHVVDEPEDADLVVVATAGRVGSFHRNDLAASLSGASDFRGSAAVGMTQQMGQGSFAADEGVVRAGLLLSAFRASEWEALSEKGTLPSAVWRVFASGEFSRGELAIAPHELAACAVATILRSTGQSLPQKTKR